jgi:DNA polymerase V
VIVHFPCPTYCTLELTKAMSEAAPNLFRQGVHYYKIGVGLVDLASVSQYKFDLFSPPKINQSLLHTLNDLNRRYGRDTLFLAAQGFDQEWAMRRDFLTPQYTIKWHSLPQIKC